MPQESDNILLEVCLYVGERVLPSREQIVAHPAIDRQHGIGRQCPGLRCARFDDWRVIGYGKKPALP